jgi:hypothetical protein
MMNAAGTAMALGGVFAYSQARALPACGFRPYSPPSLQVTSKKGKKGSE